MRKIIFRHLFIMAVIFLAGCATNRTHQIPSIKKEQPNLLFIMADQLRFDALSFAGNPEVHTPNIDRLAASGVYFENAYATTPVCVPARAAILTGNNLFKTHVMSNRDYRNDEDVPNMPTFDAVLSANGYHAEYYGKWHIPYKFAAPYKNVVKPVGNVGGDSIPSEVESFRKYLDENGIPRRQPKKNELIDKQSQRPYIPLPVDYRYGLSQKEIKRFDKAKKNRLTSQAGTFGTLQVPVNGSHAAYQAHETLQALDNINLDKPFSLTLSFGPPHAPFVVPEPYASMYKVENMSVPESINDSMKNAPYSFRTGAFKDRYRDPEMIKYMKTMYYGMITQVDSLVGRILNKLEERGVADNTLIIFTSDHGEMLGDHGLNGKVVMYEGSVHVPLIMRFPGEIPAGTKVETPVSQLNLFSTILDYMGVEIPPNDGRSLRPLINGKSPKIDYSVSADGHIKGGGPFMVRSGDWKLILYLNTKNKKVNKTNALYNLKDDPHEMNNLIGNNPNKEAFLPVARKLKQKLEEWMKRTNTLCLEECKTQHCMTNVNLIFYSVNYPIEI